MIPILWQLFCNHRRLKKTKNILVKRLPKVITRSPCGPILLGRHGILDHPKIENSGNTVINIIMWILTTNYWAKVKIQRISYTSLQQILTKHKVKRRRNLGSRTTTKLLGFQIHEKKSLLFVMHSQYANGTYGVTEIFSIKLCSNVWGDFSSKGELENSFAY